MTVSADVVVFIWKVPVAPVTDGLVMLLKVKLLAPATALVPSDRVTVTLCPKTPAVSVPSSPLGLLTPTAPKTNPAGNVTTILPVIGMALDAVKDTAALHAAPTLKEAGVTDAKVRAPAVIVTPATEVF